MPRQKKFNECPKRIINSQNNRSVSLLFYSLFLIILFRDPLILPTFYRAHAPNPYPKHPGWLGDLVAGCAEQPVHGWRVAGCTMQVSCRVEFSPWIRDEGGCECRCSSISAPHNPFAGSFMSHAVCTAGSVCCDGSIASSASTCKHSAETSC